jgi:hypothetical protein
MKKMWFAIRKMFGWTPATPSTSRQPRSSAISLQESIAGRMLRKFPPTYKVAWKFVDIKFGRPGLGRVRHVLANAQSSLDHARDDPQLAELQSHKWLLSSTRPADTDQFAEGFVVLTAFNDNVHSQLPHHLNHYTRLMELHVAKTVQCERVFMSSRLGSDGQLFMYTVCTVCASVS